jgi:hypothetical protein
MKNKKPSPTKQAWKNVVGWHLKSKDAVNTKYPSYKGRKMKRKKKE